MPLWYDLGAGPERLRIVLSSLFLGEFDVAHRMRISAGTLVIAEPYRRLPSSHATDEVDRVSVAVFTVPGHIVEQLWMTEIPRMIESGPETGSVHAGGQWPALGTLGFMLEIIEPRFQPPMQAVLSVSATGTASGSDSPWHQATQDSVCRCALVNVDETDQIFRLEPAPVTADAPVCVLTAQLLLGPGQGICWDPARVLISPAAGTSTGQSDVKLLLSTLRPTSDLPDATVSGPPSTAW